MSPEIIAAGLIGLFIGLPLAYWSALRTVRREIRAAQLRQARIDYLVTRRPQPMPADTAEPVIDDQPGINLAWHDDCELIWNTPSRTEGNR